MAQALLFVKSILRHIAIELSWRIPQGWKDGDSAVAPVARVSASLHSCGLRLSPYGAMASFIVISLFFQMVSLVADAQHQRGHFPLDRCMASRDW